MTPFLEAASDALSVEIEISPSTEIQNLIIDKIIQNAPAENSASTTVFSSFKILNKTFNTLHAELDGLLNLRLMLKTFQTAYL